MNEFHLTCDHERILHIVVRMRYGAKTILSAPYRILDRALHIVVDIALLSQQVLNS